MPRPKRCRNIELDPDCRYFKPQGVPIVDLLQTDLELDELEALRLADSVGLSQADAGSAMGISQPTFNRVLSSARKKVADSLVFGRAIRICLEAHDENERRIAGRPGNCSRIMNKDREDTL